MRCYCDIFYITIRGEKACVIRMLNAAIRNVGTGNAIMENDDVETILQKLKEKGGKHLLRVSKLDLLDEECLRDAVVQEKKKAFEKKMRYYQDVRDGKVSFESDEDESYAMYEADDALDNMYDGRLIDIVSIDVHDEVFEVGMEFYIGEEPFSSSDWAMWDDICRLYGCRIVIDDDEYLNTKYNAFYGTVIYEMEDGGVKNSHIVPELHLREYIETMDNLIKMDPARYQERKILDMEAKIRKMQAELSREKLLVALSHLDDTDGHLQVPEGVTDISEVTWKYGKKIKSIYIPASVKVINNHSISGSDIKTIEISPYNPFFCSADNCILNRERTVLLIGCGGSVIPDGITEIGDSAFSCCDGLERITIPSSVTRIGNYAFEKCSGLRELIIEDGLQEIGGLAFTGCTSLADVTLPDNLKKSLGDVFRGTPFAGDVPQNVSGEKNRTYDDSELPF